MRGRGQGKEDLGEGGERKEKWVVRGMVRG